MADAYHSNRWFRKMSDKELVGPPWIFRIGVDAQRAAREIRRRAAVAGMKVDDWEKQVRGNFRSLPASNQQCASYNFPPGQYAQLGCLPGFDGMGRNESSDTP